MVQYGIGVPNRMFRTRDGYPKLWLENITVTSQWAQWRLDGIAQPFVHAQIKENIKAARQWHLWGEFTAGRWIPLTKGQ